MNRDSCHTIIKPARAEFKDRSSKFIALAKPVGSVKEFEHDIEETRKEYNKARHVCYAYRIGFNNEDYRLHDDGEPSGTAGRPIYNQILSFDYSFISVAVIRYFGGIKLGTSGLINAYKTSTRMALDNAHAKQIFKMHSFRLIFDYAIMGELINQLKSLGMVMTEKSFAKEPYVVVSIRESQSGDQINLLKARLLKRDIETINDKTEVPHLMIHQIT